jgi:magnesium transporter
MEKQATSTQQVLISTFFQQYPTEAALTLETFSTDKILDYLSNMPEGSARKVFARLIPDLIAELITRMSNELFISIFSKLNTHLAARLLSRQDKTEVQTKLALLPELQATEIREFLSYKPDSAGYLMETTVTAFHAAHTVEEVLIRIRKHKDRTITSIFVIDEDGQLLGQVPLPLLISADHNEILKDLMQEATSVNTMSSKEEVLLILEKERMLQIPVVDINNILLGIIRNNILIDVTKQEVTEDLQAMFGAGREEQALSKVSFAVRKRLPWLQVNLATAFLASMVVGFFEETIAQITILAIFLPVVAGQSGNTGSQALGVTIRGLALREISISQWFQVARKELMVGFINGVAVAITTGVIVYFWSASFGIAIVIVISMVLSMTIAGISGAVIPLALKAVGQDPATSSSIILTTVTDICGFLSFLGLATALSSVLGIF